MEVVRVKILGKVENLVCRILRSFSTGDENGFDVHDEQGKWIKKRQVTAPIVAPTNPGAYGGTTHQLLEAHKAKQLAWKRYKLAQAATKKMIMYTFKDYHFLELQDENGVIVGYSALELFDHLMVQYVQPEDVADQITALHKILEQSYDPNEEPQVYYKSVQGAKKSLKSLNEIIDDSTLI
jgi:hypothetical protein